MKYEWIWWNTFCLEQGNILLCAAASILFQWLVCFIAFSVWKHNCSFHPDEFDFCHLWSFIFWICPHSFYLVKFTFFFIGQSHILEDCTNRMIDKGSGWISSKCFDHIWPHSHTWTLTLCCYSAHSCCVGSHCIVEFLNPSISSHLLYLTFKLNTVFIQQHNGRVALGVIWKKRIQKNLTRRSNNQN